MPLYRRTKISESISLGIWEINENPEFLKHGLILNQDETDLFLKMSSELRKKHWLSYRRILSDLTGDPSIHLFYDRFGKLHFHDGKYQVSVSHSGKFSAAIISNKTRVGIDIEMIKERIDRVKERFLTEGEMEMVEADYTLEKLTVCWGAKESLYKLYGNPELDFQKDILIEPFVLPGTGKGECKAIVTASDGRKDYTLFYEKIEDYMLVYTSETDSPGKKQIQAGH